MHFSIEIPLANAGYDLPDASLHDAIKVAVELLKQSHAARQRRGQPARSLTAVISELTPTTRRAFWRRVEAPIEPEDRERAAERPNEGVYYFTHVRARVRLDAIDAEPSVKLADRQRGHSGDEGGAR